MSYELRTPLPWTSTITDLREMFRKWGIIAWGVEPTSEAKANASDGSVTIRFVKDGKEQRYTYARLARPRDNLRALYLGLESMRMNEVRGIGDVVREMYTQLPAGKVDRDPYEVLGVRSDVALEDIEAMYRAKARRLHPDTASGDADLMKELNAAIDRIRNEKKAVEK
ncbi:MAG: J domain-containing protein [Hyphomicrobiaceae bacterium]